MNSFSSENFQIPELYKRIAICRARIEREKSMAKVLRAGPRFFCYEQAKEWVRQQGLGLATAEEWFDWIKEGEKSNPLVPSNPEEAYTRNETWKGWNDFLEIDDEDNPGFVI